MNEWLERLDRREQFSLLLLAAAIALFLAYRMLWVPVDALRDGLLGQNQSLGQTVARLDGLVSEITQLQSGGAAARPQRNLTAIINSSTKRAGLQVSRLQPNSRGEIQVRMESVAFDEFVAWLYRMEVIENLIVAEVSVTQTGTKGIVNITVRLAQGE